MTSLEESRSPGRWAGLSADARRVERRLLLLDAAFELLGTEGSSGTTVRAVCQAARLNARYFYESFPDLDALIVAVYDRVVADLRGAVTRAMDEAPTDLPAQIGAAVATTVGFVDDDRRRARVLYVEALGNEALNRRRISTGHDITSFIELDAVERRGPPPEGERIGAVTSAVLVGGISEALTVWLDGRLGISRDQLIDDLTELFVGLTDTAFRLAARRVAHGAEQSR
ncbi:MAG: TetR/AcrR family transcriptional regulator [Ilumatobacteraceae bacterium]